MDQFPELPEEIWEIILDHLKLECCTVEWTAGGDLVLPPYSQIKFVNKLFYSKLYFTPPPSLIASLPLCFRLLSEYPDFPSFCLPLIAIRYRDVKINIEFAPKSMKLIKN